MNELTDIIVYLYKNYPNPKELSKARVVKMLYLADWKNCIDSDKQITNVKWYFNHYGPYVDGIVDEIKNDSRFTTTWVNNSFGGPKELILLNPNAQVNQEIAPETSKILDFVIESTSPLYWNDFITLVYSTYPIRTQPRYTHLNLVSLAKEYKSEKTKISA